MCLRDININSLRIAVSTNDLLFKINTFGNAFNGKDVVQDFSPIRSGVSSSLTFFFPTIEKLSC